MIPPSTSWHLGFDLGQCRAERVTAAEVNKAVSGQLVILKASADNLYDLYLNGEIPEEVFKDQTNRLKADTVAVSKHLGDIAETEMGNEREFARLLIYAARVWLVVDELSHGPVGLGRQGTFDVRRRLRTALFPSASPVSKEALGTAELACSFNRSAKAETVSKILASPGGFEPPLTP